MTSERFSRERFAEEVINNLLTTKQKQSVHIQKLLDNYISGYIPIETIYQQLKDCP
jgi:hypothetical protein